MRIVRIIVHVPGDYRTSYGPSHHVLGLPVGAHRWEIDMQKGPYQPVKFIAVYPDGSVAKIIEYASGQWARYEALEEGL